MSDLNNLINNIVNKAVAESGTIRDIKENVAILFRRLGKVEEQHDDILEIKRRLVNLEEQVKQDAKEIYPLRCNMQTMIKQVQDLQERIGATNSELNKTIDRVKALESNVKPIAPPTPEEIDDLMAALLQMSNSEPEPEDDPLCYDDLVGIVRQVVREEVGSMLGSGRTVTVTISD